MVEYVGIYLNEVKKAVESLDKRQIGRVISSILDAYKKNKQIFIIGNGGSATTATHFANDLCKFCNVESKKRFRAISLTDNISTITAWANDTSYDQVFSQQLLNFINKGDLLIALSASGNSPNIIEAVKTAKGFKAKTIGFVGFDGGKLMKIADEYIHVDYHDFGIVESIHLVLEHLIVDSIKKSL